MTYTVFFVVRRDNSNGRDVHVRRIALHHAIGEISLLRQPHRIHFAADATDFAGFLAAIGIGVREVDRRIPRPFGVGRIGVGNAIASSRPNIASRRRAQTFRNYNS